MVRSFQSEGYFDLDPTPGRQTGDPDRGANTADLRTENRAEDFRSCVEHLGMPGEIRFGGNDPPQCGNTCDTVQRSDSSLSYGKCAKRADPRRLLGLERIVVRSERTGYDPIRRPGQKPGCVKAVAIPAPDRITPHCFWFIRQDQPLRLKPCCGALHGIHAGTTVRL